MQYIKGIISLFLMLLSSAFFSVIFVLFRLINIAFLRQKHINILYNICIKRIYFTWIWINELLILKFLKLKINMPDIKQLDQDKWYLIISNHQGFFDILVLQILCRKYRLYNKFFMKESLIYLPFIGISCWGLDFVFIKRFTKKSLKQNPEKIQQQHDYIINKCKYFKTYPCSVINFVEGTRHSKFKAEKSPYNNLLTPQPMGLSLLIKEFASTVGELVDVSIIYPKHNNFFDMFYKEGIEINLLIETYDISKELIGNYRADKNYRNIFNSWLKNLWKYKDTQLTIAKEQLHEVQ